MFMILQCIHTYIYNDIDFSWQKIFKRRLKIFNINLDNGLALNRQQAAIWSNANAVQFSPYIYGELAGS